MISIQICLRVLVELPPSSEPSTILINVIFVLGLGGSAKGTWTDSQIDGFWPLWLPAVKGLENTRILSFRYDSIWNKFWKLNNILNISDFAK